MSNQSHNEPGARSASPKPEKSASSAKDAVLKVLWEVAAFAFIAVLVWWCCPYTLMSQETRCTMYYDAATVTPMLARPGGANAVLALMLVENFTTTIAAVAITSLIAAVCVCFLASIFRKIFGALTAPLSIAAGSAIALVYCYPAYGYNGLTATALCIFSLWATCQISHWRVRLAAAIIITGLLWWVCGAVCMLYAGAISVIELYVSKWRGSAFLLCVALALALGILGVRTGQYADLARAITPAAYYTAWLSAPDGLWWAWGTIIASVIAAALLSRIKIETEKALRIAALGCLTAGLGTSAVCAIDLRQPKEEKFLCLSILTAKGEWQQVMERSRDLDKDDIRSQNCRNLALAQTGQLSKALFNTPCSGPRGLIDTSGKSPEMYMTLSDIFFSMGLMSLAQKYAFEANEGFGDHSPRMLMRLADISIASGQYAVARKYLNLLSKTRHYASWARDRKLMLDDADAVNADAELMRLRKSLNITDHFAGDKGIAYEMTEIVRHDPTNKLALDYLGMWLLTQKRVPDFTAMIAEFYGTEALPTPLPKHFQEAIAVAALATDERLDLKYDLHPSTIEQCRRFWADHRDQPNTFWHYLKHNKED